MRADLKFRLYYLAAWPAWYGATLFHDSSQRMDRLACWLEGRAELAEERVLMAEAKALIDRWAKDVEVPS